MATLSYQLLIDTGRDSTLASDFTPYLERVSWNVGMASSFQEFAPPSRCSITLNNLAGVFNQDGLGSELIQNGNFANWTADNPNNWTVTGESATDPQVSQVSAGGVHGDSGTGVCNIYTSSAAVSIKQTVLTPGQRYYYTFTVDTVTAGGIVLSNNGVTIATYTTPGIKTGTFTATATDFTLANSGATDVNVDDVSVKTCPTYYNRLKRGVLVRLKATYNDTTYTLWNGHIINTTVQPGAYHSRFVTLECEDPMVELLDSEYMPALQTNVTTDVALATVFDTATLVYPYKHAYWVLGFGGYSELDSSTTLFNHVNTSFETGKTTLIYVGDNADKGLGVSAQGFLRDIVAAEAGGRFWWDGRNAYFVFHNRHHDLSNTTIVATFTSADFEDAQSMYGKDLVNDVTVNFEPRSVGTAGSVLWSDSSVPFLVGDGEQRRVSARYNNPNAPGSRCGGQDMIPMSATTDYIANSASDGTGTNLTDNVALSVTYNASSAEIVINNDSGYVGYHQPFYITFLQVRGTPLTVHEAAFANAFDGQSQIDNGVVKKEYNLRAINDLDTAQQFANWWIGRYKNPLSRFESVSFTTSKNDDMQGYALSLKVADKIAVSDTFTGHSGNYVIVGEQHSLEAGEDMLHKVTWVLKLDLKAIGWVLEQAGRSELDETTYVVF